jgi:hypothetical protein
MYFGCMDTGEGRRRRRRNMEDASAPAPAVDPFSLSVPAPAQTPRQVLGVRPGSNALQVVQAYQRALSSAKSNDRRRELAMAFRQLGAQPIRTRCPEGHTIVLYAIDGETHSVYCQQCHDSQKDYSTYDYIGWAQCLKVTTAEAEPIGVEELPLGAEPLPQRQVHIAYHASSGNKSLTFVMDGSIPLTFGAGDSFTVIMRGRTPWWLLNHTSAVMIPLDILRSHRKELEEAAAARKARLLHQGR